MEHYNFKETEKKWQEYWEKNKSFYFDPKSKKQKFYMLEMFPYPSGELHVGHLRNFAIGDVIARFKTMQGYNVLHPMGADAFGLPAENAAIKRQINPSEWTKNNIETFIQGMKKIGLSYDFSRFLATCFPDYYGKQQKIFIDFYKNGLAYQKEGFVNWDPVDQTVLANEQVVDGRGWRSGAIVEKKKLNQWCFNITKYAEELLNDIDDKLQAWSEKVRIMQKNWIGKSEGVLVRFEICDPTPLIRGDVNVVDRGVKSSSLNNNTLGITPPLRGSQTTEGCLVGGKDNNSLTLGITPPLIRGDVNVVDRGIKSSSLNNNSNNSKQQENPPVCSTNFPPYQGGEERLVAPHQNSDAVLTPPQGGSDSNCNIIQENHSYQGIKDQITVYTTRPDTLFGASFIGIASNHPIAETLAKNNLQIANFIKECQKNAVNEETLETMEKKGIDTGLKAKNPFTNEELPVYIANFILMDYGTGAIFGCPAHDERDYEFAKKYGLNIKQVVSKNLNTLGITTPLIMGDANVVDMWVKSSSLNNNTLGIAPPLRGSQTTEGCLVGGKDNNSKQQENPPVCSANFPPYQGGEKRLVAPHQNSDAALALP